MPLGYQAMARFARTGGRGETIPADQPCRSDPVGDGCNVAAASPIGAILPDFHQHWAEGVRS